MCVLADKAPFAMLLVLQHYDTESVSTVKCLLHVVLPDSIDFSNVVKNGE